MTSFVWRGMRFYEFDVAISSIKPRLTQEINHKPKMKGTVYYRNINPEFPVSG